MAHTPQTFENHGRIVPLFHGVLFGIIALGLIGSVVNLVTVDHAGLYSASLITAGFVAMLLLFYFARLFALKAQDRAIRAEEALRHFVLAGRPLDPRLNLGQVIGLRFASDEEFVALAARAADEGLSPDDIKRAVTNWRADHHRV